MRSNFDNTEVQDAIEKLRYCATVERRRDNDVHIVPDADDNCEDITVKTAKNVLYWINTNNEVCFFFFSILHFINLSARNI